MGKHSKEKNSNNTIIKIIILLLIVTIVFILLYNKNDKTNTSNTIENQIINQNENTNKTIEGKKLVLKSCYDFNKIIEYDFENDQLIEINISEQYEDKEKYEKAKENFKNLKKYQLIESDDNKLLIEYKRIDFGADEGLSYDELYEKYTVKILGAYEVVE